MRCDCCNKLLEDVDATARFADSGNFVGMCPKCRGFLPKDLKINYRSDLTRSESEEDASDDTEKFDVEDYDDESDDWTE